MNSNKRFSRINTTIQKNAEKVIVEHAAEALRFRNMAEFGKRKASHCSKQGDYPKAKRWEQWAHYKELEAEYHESQI